MGARKKVFTEEFLKENFGKEHMEAFNEEIKGEGYPDMGGGKYSQKLSYKQWYEFNSAQRAHYNFLEWIASTLAILLIAGIYFPIPSAALGLAIFLGRLIYAIGYMTGGPQGRLIGVLINDFAFLGAFVLSFISSVFFIVGKQN
jgi:glutathione S-transferase